MLESLIAEVLEANRALPAHGLVKLTTGNASGLDRERGVIVIKPSGVAYAEMTAADMVVLDLDGNVVAGERTPSSDTPTHLALYRAFPEIGGVVHTHSSWATAFSQAERTIPVLGKTHADLTEYEIPLTRQLHPEELPADQAAATGTAVVEAIAGRPPLAVPCVLVRRHAPFCWGATPAEAVDHAVRLEEVAHLAALTSMLNPAVRHNAPGHEL